MRGKNFYSFQSTNLVKAHFTEIGLLTSGMPLHYHLNIHVVHPIIKWRILQGTFVKSCFSLCKTERLNVPAEAFFSLKAELPERQILLHSMFAWGAAWWCSAPQCKKDHESMGWLGVFFVWSLHVPCVCVSSLWALWLPPTDQRHAC